MAVLFRFLIMSKRSALDFWSRWEARRAFVGTMPDEDDEDEDEDNVVKLAFILPDSMHFTRPVLDNDDQRKA